MSEDFTTVLIDTEQTTVNENTSNKPCLYGLFYFLVFAVVICALVFFMKYFSNGAGM